MSNVVSCKISLYFVVYRSQYAVSEYIFVYSIQLVFKPMFRLLY